MRLVTRDHLSDGVRRMFREFFGPPAETAELPIKTEADRLFAAAVVLADDFRHMPETGLSNASAEERFLAAYTRVRTLRDLEAGRDGGITAGELPYLPAHFRHRRKCLDCDLLHLCDDPMSSCCCACGSTRLVSAPWGGRRSLEDEHGGGM